MAVMLGNDRKLISVCGKGGAGKTVVTAMMARALVESGRAGKMLVIDADPALGQTSAMGVKVRRTMGQVREEIIKTVRGGKEEEKAAIAEKLDYMVFEALTEMEDFALLAMGRTETLGCYCPVNSLLRAAIETLSRAFDTILIDGEAGLEQINRQVVRRLDTLMIVSDPSSRGIQTAAAIKNMVERDRVIECGRLGLVFNRVTGDESLLRQCAEGIGIEVFGLIPDDKNITAHDLVGKPITQLPHDSPGRLAMRELVAHWVLA